MSRICVRLTIFGIVHGVFFRATMADVASREGVSGWVRNVPNGSVEALLEGEEASVTRVVEWARHGPSRARVDSVRVERQQLRNTKGFRIDG
jgi:acylphosphatase